MKVLLNILCILCLLSWSCKKSEISSIKKTTNVAVSGKDTLDQVGTWKWVAQYDLGNPNGDLFTPSSTGIQETLNMDANYNWVQMQNGVEVNSGKYRFNNALTPGGPILALTLNNSADPNAQVYDNFDFNTGFSCSFAMSKDTLIFYGVYNNNGQSASIVSERIYTK